MVELVIKISEDTYKDIVKNGFIYDEDSEVISHAIINGIPLPKGHGDLKDMNDIYEALEGWDDDTGWIVDAIDCQTQTIIEADKSESKDKR